jgi:molybdopterin-guanine dinucleotide biosynthesis protein A
MPSLADDVVGVILAGGRSQRMGGTNKAFVQLGERPLISHVQERLRRQVHRTIVNANDDPSRYSGDAVVPDLSPDFPGPLAGILAAMVWVEAHEPAIEWIVTVPADTPFIPPDLVAWLAGSATTPQTIAVARSRGIQHHAVALVPVALREQLALWLAMSPDRSIKSWLAHNGAVPVDFVDGREGDPFFNVNTPEDLQRAEEIVARSAAT